MRHLKWGLHSRWTGLAASMAIGLAVSFSAGAQLAQTGAGSSKGKTFDGVSLNVMTFDGPQVAEPLKRRGKEFAEATGAKVTVNTVPFSKLYDTLIKDWSSASPKIDAAIMVPQWMPDLVGNKLLENLDSRLDKDPALRKTDIAPFFVIYSQRYGQRTYLLTLDEDFLLVYYRKDILEKLGRQPPRTWTEYLEIASTAHGKDFGDGKPVSGSCIAKKKGSQSYWMVYAFASPYLQAKGTQEGVFFNRADLQPLVFNDGFARAMTIYGETTKYGPKDELKLDVGDTRKLFVNGECALTLDWGDVGPLAAEAGKSKVIGKVGTVMLPGSREVLNRVTGKVEPCTASSCPYMIKGVNHAPYAASGGWAGGINAKASEASKSAAYALFSYMSQPAQSNVDVSWSSISEHPDRNWG